ncbi:MAG: ATP-binding protein [Acidimicrobiales bacterium]
MSEPERLTPDELRTLFLFEALSDERLAWLAERGRIVEYAAGEVVYTEGAPATCFLVLLSGTLSMTTRVQGGEIELFRTDYRGAYAGAFSAYMADKGVPQIYQGSVRAVTDCRFYEIPAADFGRMVKEWFPMAAHLLEGSWLQGQAATDTVARHERLVALGSVTAGLTHELNNPVAAVMRATATLRERLAAMRAEVGVLAHGGLSSSQLEALADLAGRALEHRGVAAPLSALDESDREDELAGWLDDHGTARSWELAAPLAAAGVDIAWAEDLAKVMPTEQFEAGLTYTVGLLESDSLLDEIAEAAGRISQLLAAAKQYTQMDRAPLQSFDIHEGLDSTLTMLGHKLGDEIDVVREYDRNLRRIQAFPGELNQVWTNLIDNAVDAMGGRGTLTVRTRPDGDERVLVEIGDTGPGLPDEMRTRIFEPFFTTKPVGKGTGLGLDIAWRIVVGRHRGDIRVESVPGDTRFQVCLPIREPDA